MIIRIMKLRLIYLLTMIITFTSASHSKSEYTRNHEKLSAKNREAKLTSKTYFNFPRPTVMSHENQEESVVSDFV